MGRDVGEHQPVPSGLGPLVATRMAPRGWCTCPHFGYMIEGSWIVDYTDGTSETIHAGESFYVPATHNGARSLEGALVAEFSPVDQLAPVMADREADGRDG